jgi:hypothetical protein
MKINLTSISEHSDYLSASTYSDSEKWQFHRMRVRFGKKLLEIWQFVPCKLVDGVWVILKEPYDKDFYTPMPERNGKKAWRTNRDKFELALKEYQEAKERCLFEGFELITDKGEFITIQNINGYLNWNKKESHFMFYSGFCIERLMESFDLELTPTAQKQIGLCLPKN